MLYLAEKHPRPAGPMQIPGVKGQITQARLLADPDRTALKFTQTEQGVSIQLPEKAPDAIASALCLSVKGEIEATAAAEQK
jgi:hypothetical protein